MTLIRPVATILLPVADVVPGDTLTVGAGGLVSATWAVWAGLLRTWANYTRCVCVCVVFFWGGGGGGGRESKARNRLALRVAFTILFVSFAEPVEALGSLTYEQFEENTKHKRDTASP